MHVHASRIGNAYHIIRSFSTLRAFDLGVELLDVDQLLSASFEDIAPQAAPVPRKASKSAKATASVRLGPHEPVKAKSVSKRPAHAAESDTLKKPASRKRSKVSKDHGAPL